MRLTQTDTNANNANFEEFTQIINDFDLSEYDDRKKFLKRLFKFYRSNRRTKPMSAAVQYAERLIQLDAEQIQRNHLDKYKDSHNAFVLYYAGKLNPRAIANKMNRTPRSVFELISRTHKRLMIYVFGIDGLMREVPEADF